MPLMLQVENTGMPFIRYSSNEDMWMHSQEEGGMLDIPHQDGALPSPMIIDVENIKMGWLMLATGARDWQPYPSLTEPTPKPGDDYKEGFSVKVFSKKLFDDAPLREFCSSGAGIMMFIKRLYDECESEFGKGKVPAVSILKTPHMKFGKGTTRNVQYKIVKWVDRPEDMLAESAPSVESNEQKSSTEAAPATESDVFDDDEI